MVEMKCLYGFDEKTYRIEVTWKTRLGWEGKGKFQPRTGDEGPER
jgi:hypothetical protein